MNIALLYNLNRGQTAHETEFDIPLTIERLGMALRQLGDVTFVEAALPLSNWIVELERLKPDIVFNVAEGYAGEVREALYPLVLDQLRLAYTGPNARNLALCHDKELCKRLVAVDGVNTAAGAYVNGSGEADDLESIPLPAIVKLNYAGSSLGMGADSIVTTSEQLRARVDWLHGQYRAAVLVEEFIPGVDISTTYIEGLGVFGPVEYVLNGGVFYDYRLKSVDNHTIDVARTAVCEMIRDEAVAITQKIVDMLGLNGYARLDFRYDPARRRLAFLETNGQVSFHPIGAFILAVTTWSDLSYDDVVQHLVRSRIPREISQQML